MTTSTTLALKFALGFLMIDSIIELSFISSMVAFLHRRAGGDILIDYNGTTFPLHGKPVGLLADQGHTSNGAAGTAFILIGIGGFLALWLRGRSGRWGGFFHAFWLVMTTLSTLLTLAALIYTFVLTHNHAHQHIDISVAMALPNHPYPDHVAYPLDFWTPENWFKAVLELPLAESSEGSEIRGRVRVMEGWRWNLVAMFVVGLGVCVLGFVERMQYRRAVARDLEVEKMSS